MKKAQILLENDLYKVEAEFKRQLAADTPLIHQVGKYLLDSGGKRIRPLLLLLAANLAGYKGESHITHACIIEFIHTATLLHDDVVDSAILRRGKDSANSVWGNATAVLVGDFLMARSFAVLAKEADLRIISVLAEASTVMAEGEILQLEKTNDTAITEDDYIKIINGKTAVLLSAACRIGAILANLPPEKEEALTGFGRELGVAFQLMDDTLDYIADESTFGKSQGQDLHEGKVTFPLIHTLKECTDEERSEIAIIVKSKELPQESFNRISSLINQYQGIEQTYKRATQHIQAAKDQIAEFAESPAKEAMLELAEYVVTRKK